jgi:hypothetical protein
LFKGPEPRALSLAVSLFGIVGTRTAFSVDCVIAELAETLSERPPPLVPDIAQIIKAMAKQTTAMGRIIA